MKKLSIILGLLVTALLLVAWSPSPALSGVTGSHRNDDDTSKLVVVNKTKEKLTLTLEGTATWTVRIPTGRSSYEVLPGRYTYSFEACGVTETGSINLNDDETLKIPDCPEISTASFRVNNRTKDRVSITLQGVESYTLNAKADGKTNFINLVPGIYSYSIDACGLTWRGVVNLNDDTNDVIKIQECLKEKTSEITIRNKTTEKVTVALSGVNEFEFSVNSDRKKNFEVNRGVYGYAYEACNEKAIGVMNLVSDDTLKIVECVPQKSLGVLSINNRTVELITVRLLGAGGSYSFTASTGFNSGNDVVKGVYTYSFEACGGTHTGKIRVGNHETLKIRPC
jgi:hypothetical protein